MKRRASLLVSLVILLAGLPLLASSDADGSKRVQDLMVPMRDGVRLATTVYLPAGEGPWPAIVTRTPYGKDGRYSESHGRYTEHGFVFVAQDQRGRFASEGEYVPHEAEIEDGYDTVEWIARQPWCSGKVGISGGSAMGIAANLAAASNPPHLVAAYVTVAPQSLFYEGRFVGGVFKEADTGNWMRRQGVSEEGVRAYKKRVILDPRWQETDLVFHLHAIDIPIYNVGGWYDLFLAGNVRNFSYLQEWGREGARGNQKLLVGPFGHGALRGDLEYVGEGGLRRGPNDELRWFDYWLRGIDNGIMEEPPVRYYQMAAARKGAFSPKNGYRSAESWPPNGSKRVRFYLRQGRRISRESPAAQEPPSSYRFDPAQPVPTVGGLNLTLPLGPMDQRKIEPRPDYLRYESEPLPRDLVLAGKVDLELYASTDGPDTDFMVKLVDVYPDGYEALVLDTALKTRYRDGRRPQDVRMMTPGEPERMVIDLWYTALRLEKGHRLAVHLTSSNHPRFEVNPNTGEEPGESALPPRVATNTIYHDAGRPTALVLPVLESGPMP